MTEYMNNSAVVPSICVFDVNETLLDIEFLSPLFQRLFGDNKVMREWFGQLILYSEAITLSGRYTTFFTLGQGVLQMLGSIHNVSLLPRCHPKVRSVPSFARTQPTRTITEHSERIWKFLRYLLS